MALVLDWVDGTVVSEIQGSGVVDIGWGDGLNVRWDFIFHSQVALGELGWSHSSELVQRHLPVRVRSVMGSDLVVSSGEDRKTVFVLSGGSFQSSMFQLPMGI